MAIEEAKKKTANLFEIPADTLFLKLISGELRLAKIEQLIRKALA